MEIPKSSLKYIIKMISENKVSSDTAWLLLGVLNPPVDRVERKGPLASRGDSIRFRGEQATVLGYRPVRNLYVIRTESGDLIRQIHPNVLRYNSGVINRFEKPFVRNRDRDLSLNDYLSLLQKTQKSFSL